MSEIGMQKLSDVINRELTLYTTEVQNAVRNAAITVGGEIVTELRSSSPKRTGRYAKSWTLDKHKKNGVVIRNAKHYRLTHLLEYGYVSAKSGRRTKSYPHIKKAEERGVQKFTDEVEKLLNSM